MRDGKNGNDRIETEWKNGTPEKGSGVLPKDVSWRVAWALESGMAAVSATFESALDRVVETWGKYRRLWLVRHFDYEDSEEAREYVKKSKEDKSKMNEDELKALNELSKKVRANVDDPFIQRILLWSLRKRPDATKASVYLDIEASIAARNRMTHEWVANSGDLNDWMITKRFKITTEKVADTGEKTFRAFSEIGGIMNDWIADKDWGDGVIFGNRTPSHAFWLRVWRPCYTEKDHTDQMERLGYDFWDVEKATGKPILTQDWETLRVTLENLNGIEKAILNACDDTQRKAKISKAFSELPLIMLQEAVNDMLGALRASKPNEYLVVLRSLSEWKGTGGRHDPELQSYVFERLMESWFSWETLLRSEWSTGALEWMATKGYREMVIRYFWESEEGPVDNLGPFAKSINVKGMKKLFADAYEYWKIRQRQKRSVDPAIRIGNGFYVKRSLQIESPYDWHPVPGNSEDVLKIAEKGVVLLSGGIGIGKSTWLCEFAKSAILKGIPVSFFEVGELEARWFEKNWKMHSLFELWDDRLFIFDGLDEIDDEEIRMAMVKWLDVAWTRTIVSSRPWCYLGKDTEVTEVTLEEVDGDSFIEARIWETNARKIRELMDKGTYLGKINGNPLFLSMLAMLAEIEMGDFQKYGILPLESIRTESQLVEAAARFALGSHENRARWQKTSKYVVERQMDELSRYAFSLWQGEEAEPDKDFDSHISLLSKDANGKYGFFHAAFLSYFVARHLSTTDDPRSVLTDWKNSHMADCLYAPVSGKWRKTASSLSRLLEILCKNGDLEGAVRLFRHVGSSEFDDGIGSAFFACWNSARKLDDNGMKEALEHVASDLVRNWSMSELALRMPWLFVLQWESWYPECPVLDEVVLPCLENELRNSKRSGKGPHTLLLKLGTEKAVRLWMGITEDKEKWDNDFDRREFIEAAATLFWPSFLTKIKLKPTDWSWYLHCLKNHGSKEYEAHFELMKNEILKWKNDLPPDLAPGFVNVVSQLIAHRTLFNVPDSELESALREEIKLLEAAGSDVTHMESLHMNLAKRECFSYELYFRLRPYEKSERAKLLSWRSRNDDLDEMVAYANEEGRPLKSFVSDDFSEFYAERNLPIREKWAADAVGYSFVSATEQSRTLWRVVHEHSDKT